MERSLTIAVVGLGKIGLPIAAQYASRGHAVIGVDIRRDIVAIVNAGKTHIRGEPFLDDRVSKAVAAGSLRATRDTANAVAEASVVVVAVPLITDADGKAEFAAIDEVTKTVGSSLKSGTLILYETTLPLGTTRGRLAPILEQRSGLRLGKSIFLAFSPERVYSGRVFEDLAKYPKIVGGVDAESTARAVAFYSSVLEAEVLAVANCETAEYAKLAETTYRFVNIALADQLALFGRERGVDVAEAFAAANTQPFSHIHQPGIGVGGHCIPVYPRFLLETSRNGELSLVRDAQLVDGAMPATYVNLLSEALGGLRGKRVVVLGVSYRPDVKESAFSAAFPVVTSLKEHGASVVVHDPLFSEDELRNLGFEPTSLQEPTPADGVIVQAFHRQYRDLTWKLFTGLRAVIDGRGDLPVALFDEGDIALISLGSSERLGFPAR
jgi:nucleotide sugar dehydrogenase